MKKLKWIKDYYDGLSRRGKKLFLVGVLCSLILAAEAIRTVFFA